MNPNDETTPNWQRRRNWALVAVFFGGALYGPVAFWVAWQNQRVVTPGFQTTTGYDILGDLIYSLAMAVPIYLWYRYDDRLRQFSLSRGFHLLIFFLGFVGVPVYFWRSRTPAERWSSLLGFFLFAFWAAGFFLSLWLTNIVAALSRGT